MFTRLAQVEYHVTFVVGVQYIQFSLAIVTDFCNQPIDSFLVHDQACAEKVVPFPLKKIKDSVKLKYHTPHKNKRLSEMDHFLQHKKVYNFTLSPQA